MSSRDLGRRSSSTCPYVLNLNQSQLQYQPEPSAQTCCCADQHVVLSWRIDQLTCCGQQSRAPSLSGLAAFTLAPQLRLLQRTYQPMTPNYRVRVNVNQLFSAFGSGHKAEAQQLDADLREDDERQATQASS